MPLVAQLPGTEEASNGNAYYRVLNTGYLTGQHHENPLLIASLCHGERRERFFLGSERRAAGSDAERCTCDCMRRWMLHYHHQHYHLHS